MPTVAIKSPAATRTKVKGRAKTDGKFTMRHGNAILTVPFSANTTAAELTRKVNEAVAQSGLPWVPFAG